ncbi:MAG: formate dehydrogenase accessory sulfurtransferase FdhD [Anaerolineales bacterium]
METVPLLATQIIQVKNNIAEERALSVVNEARLSLTVNGDLWLSFLCTPINQIELAVGFLYNEDIINSKNQIADVRLCDSGDNVDVWLTFPATKPNSWLRTSGCSGGFTADEQKNNNPIKPQSIQLTHSQVFNIIQELFEHQHLYQESGGIHISALSDGNKLILSAEDIGRHNTLDKLAGMKLLQQISAPTKIIITSGRVTSEMMQKALRLDAEMVITRTSPSVLSMKMADINGVTLIGYAKRSQFNIYTHPERIIPD